VNEEQIFLAALDLPDAVARNAYLDEACSENSALRGQVEALLASHFKSGEFLDVPAPEQISVEPTVDSGLSHAVTIQSDVMPANQASADEAESLEFLAPPTRPDSLGRIDHYEVLQVLGKGGFGIVFRAFDDVLQRVVAIKVMAPQMAATSPARRRFLREARTSAQVRHENVVQVYEVGEQPLPYLVMEFIPGETLQQRLDRVGPLDVQETLRIGRQIAEGLAAAHAMDLIHRDIKPGNVLLEGGQHKVKITDFGLARAADDASMTQSGQIAGTPMYMAPEQALGETLDQRVDLFSLGTVLYQMAAGRPPFRANTAVAVLKRVAEDTPRNIREVIPETPQWLCDIIAKLHAKNPDERYQSAREVADVLADCEEQLKVNSRLQDFSRIPRGSSAARRSARRKWAALAAVVIFFSAIALAQLEFAGVTNWFRGRQPVVAVGPISTTNRGPTAAKRVDPQDEPATVGFVKLFNGKDLTGWKTHSLSGGNWRVEDGAIDGRGTTSYLFSESGDYADFHLRVEAKINGNGDAGVYIRTPFDVQGLPNTGPAKFALLAGYEAAIALRANYPTHTGSLTAADGSTLHAGPLMPHEPDEWFVLEVIAEDNHIRTLVDGKPAADYTDENRRSTRGHIALQAWGPNITSVQFRKVEIKPLPSAGPLPPTYTNNLGMEFVIVPKGKAWLGGGQDKLGDREVVIPADFYLGKYEVTQEEWEQVMGEHTSHFSRTGGGMDAVKDIPDADLKRFPVESVSWDQCQVFVAKLNQREKETGWVYRLPTEMEWEYACRGGPLTDRMDSAFDYYFAKPTNTLLPEQANIGNDEGLNRPCKVGSYQPNPLGLHDMHGNAFEWCDDGRSVGSKVLKGGSWASTKSNAMSAAFPGAAATGGRFNSIGLRLARVPTSTTSPEPKTPPVAIAPFTHADVQRIAALPAEQQVAAVVASLKERNPGLNGTASHKIVDGVVTELNFNPTDDQNALTDVSPVRALAGLTSLNLWNCSALADLGPLQGLPLTRLLIGSLSVSNQVRDLKPLQGMRLTELQLYQCQVEDLQPLAGMPLTRLRVQSRQVRDCEPLKGMPLTTLDLSNCTQIQDFTPLTGLPLTALHLNACQIRDLQPLLGLKLTEVSLAGTRVQDLEQLKGMPLKNLAIHRTGVTDLTPLQGMELEEIFLTPKNITQGLNHLRDMRSLNTIGIGYASTEKWPAAEFWDRYDKEEFALAPFTESDAKRIAALPAAEQVEEVRKELMRRNPGFDGQVGHRIEGDVVVEFSIVTDQVTDISPVRALSGLRSLSCSGSFVGLGQLGASALLPLKGLPLTHLDFRDSPAVSDLSALAGMKLTSLDCRATSVGDADLKHLAGMNDLQMLSLWGTKVTDAGLKELAGLKNLQHLSLQTTKVTDAGLKEIVGLDKLVYLDLYALSGVTDAGLEHLARLKTLKHLDLRGPTVKDADVDKLASARPALRILTWDRVIEPKVVPFTDADAQRIAALPAAEQVEEVRKELQRLNPGFDGKLTPTIENDVVTEVSVNTDQITNIAPVRALTKLIYLDCRGTYPNKGKLSDLSPIKGMKLSRIDCSSTQIADLAPLAGLPLTFLHFNHNPVSDLTPLQGMPLVELGIAETKVSDLSPLKGMKLRMLGAQLLPVTDLSPLAGMPLKGLDLYHTIGVTSLEPLRGMPLEGLNLQDVPVSDLSPLQGMTTLRSLLLQANEVTDLTPLNGLKLTDLILQDKQISDLSPLKGMPLIRLHIYGTSVSDLTPLQGMPLQEFRLTPQNFTQGLDILREIKSLQTIGIDGNQAWPPAEFWERLDKGEFK